MKTKKVSKNETAPLIPLDANARTKEAVAEYSSSIEVEGRTKRCR
jgi:hypothetical protein